MAGLYWFNGQPAAAGLVPSPFDLLAHVAVYGFLTVLVWLALEGRYPWLAVLIVAAYGGADELRQLTLPGRDGSFTDFAADLAAALTITLALSVMRTRNLLPAWLVR